MISAIPVVAENRIREAMEQGQFDHLEGEGQPLELPADYEPDWWIKKNLEHERE